MEPEIKPQNKTVQTYAEDMAGVIEDSGGSLVKRIIHEQEERESEQKNQNPESNKVFMAVSFLLVLLSLVALFFLFYFKKNIFTVGIDPQFVPLVFSDKTVFSEIDDFKKEEISATVWNEANTLDIKKGGLQALYFTEGKEVIGFPQLAALLESNIPPELLGHIDNNFLVGILNHDNSKNIFFLLKVRSFADIFPGMRAWEGKMLTDLHGFFGVDLFAETNYLFSKDFENGIMDNKNARILYDSDRNIVLMYVFADDKSVIVANTPAAVHEAMDRLAASRAKK